MSREHCAATQSASFTAPAAGHGQRPCARTVAGQVGLELGVAVAAVLEAERLEPGGGPAPAQRVSCSRRQEGGGREVHRTTVVGSSVYILVSSDQGSSLADVPPPPKPSLSREQANEG